MRCLYCDGKLPLYRKITHGQFCSTAHRKAYWQEQERLAVERLHQTHNSLRAHRPTVPAEAILGPAESAVAELGTAALSGFITTLLVPHNGGGPRMVVTDPQQYELPQLLDAPVWTLPEPAARELASAGAISLRWVPSPRNLLLTSGGDPQEFELPQVLNAPVWTLPGSAARELASAGPVSLRWVPTPRNLLLTSASEMTLREVSIPVCRPVGHFVLSAGSLPVAEATQIPFVADAVSSAVNVRSTAPEPAPLRVPAPFTNLQLNAAPEPLQLPVPEPEEQAPFADRLFALPKFTSAKIASSPIAFPQALAAKPQAMLPYDGSLTIAAARLNLSMGKGSRYPIEIRADHARTTEPEPADLTVLPPEIALPDRSAEAVLQAAEQTIDAFIPAASVTLLPLMFDAADMAAKPKATRVMVVSTIPQPLRTKPVLPGSKLEPLNPRPVFELPEVPAPLLAEASAAPTVQPQLEPKHLWSHAADFWKQAPRDLKILLFTIPALLVLAFHPPLPKVHFSVPAAAGASTGQVTQNVSTAVKGQWANVRQAVFDRAAVALDEDFRSGLDDWTSRGDATAEWSFDATGFVRPGPLALYRPSMNLTDYQMQFLGLIDKKALSWVVRAVDFDNYYVVKMVVLKPGPLTTLGITRYAVIDGKAQDRRDTIVPVDARPDMLYRVTMDVHDDTFALSIQGQMTDSWSEPRLAKGGIGFFNSKGEESRVRWVQVTHQYDMLGRLCAYLAPYNIPTNGSW